ncbi:hypothetical protein [Spiroplasma endosymbiont of Nebria brevicollis]|uniref:hypothetical protein n=1 Tax=Spiroplasma endosymbiont of Nebria brevicollis TaxID=3066284 RepID=UPI00313C1C5F
MPYVELDQIEAKLKRSRKAYEPEPEFTEKEIKDYEKQIRDIKKKAKKFHNY